MPVAPSEVIDYFNKDYLRRFKRLTPKTRETYFTYLAEYLKEHGTDFSEEKVENFLRSLPKSVRNKAFYALKHYAKHNKIPFNFEVSDMPQEFWYSEWDREYAEPFKRSEIKKFCEAVVQKKYRPVDAAALVLAIVYGLRKVEMVKMEPEKDIDIKKRVFLVKTAKKGKTRLHYIPFSILPHFAYMAKNKVRFKFIENYNTFVRLSRIAGVKIKPRRAWHGFRRSLVTALLESGIPDVKVYDFMRWSRREIIYKYYHPEPILTDKEILQVHPFLPWLSPNGRVVL